MDVTKYACQPNGSSWRGETTSTPLPLSAEIRYRTTLRSACPGRLQVKLALAGSADGSIVTVKRGSFVMLILSRKYSTDTLESWFVAEKIISSRTGSFERIMISPLVASTTEKATTTGNGVVSWTELVRPGVGPVSSGDASQFAGSVAGLLKLTRSSERPRYWKLLESKPVHSSSAPRASAPMAQGNDDE